LSAVDQTPFRLEADSDGYPQLYRSIGRTAKPDAGVGMKWFSANRNPAFAGFSISIT
jgi:hypothetical protein